MKEKALFVGFVFLAALSLVQAQISDVSVLDLALTNQNPYPVEPGSNVNIEVQISNTGFAEASNVVLEIMPSDPFTLLPGEEAAKTFTRISGRESFRKSYNLHVREDALSNEYEVTFRIYSQLTPQNYVEKEVVVNVEGAPKIVLESLTTVPDDIEPGSTVKLVARIKNIGGGKANQLQLKFNSSSAILVPVLAKGMVLVGSLGPDESKQAELELSIDTSAEHKTYTATITAIYKDESNTEQAESFSIGIPVKGVITMDVIKIEPDFNRNVVDIEIANKGTADASSVEAKLVLNEKTIGIDYVSQLKATKKTTFDFPLIKDGVLTEGIGELVVTYTTPNLEKVTVTKEVDLSYELPTGNTGLGNIILVVIIVVVVYFVWKKYLRKKK